MIILQHRLKASAERPAIELVKEYGELPLVECYAGQLNQVFMNIMANVIDAIDEVMSKKIRGIDNRPESANYPLPKIRIHTEVINGEKVAIQIADNGPGMPEKVRQRLFEPFFTTKPVGKGTGLGLSITYQIVVDKHGGQLSCISAPGEGTKFMIEIPLRTALSKVL
ncbi:MULTISPECIES: ATP-binding protein [unclassified Coleofasciculus]|uniref:ATP-binding protein n=1 Tax=Cyanophyceae TaxID=3028117 RepID=UPI0018F04A25